ncbi:YciI family protein [Gordonia terrae]|uniref:YciI family protein n=1 Tax=Gordonia terrae TaxID=2055 RepID=UPI003F6C6F33
MKIAIHVSTYEREPTPEETEAHVGWLIERQNAGVLLAAGLRSTGDGGVVILGEHDSLDTIDSDPYAAAGVATYDTTTLEAALGTLATQDR